MARNWIGLCLVLACGATPLSAQPAGKPDAATLARVIDREIDAKMAQAKARPVPQADDAEFLRRLYLDLTGVIPSAEQAPHFSIAATRTSGSSRSPRWSRTRPMPSI